MTDTTKPAHRDRTMPSDKRAAIMRAAGDAIGSEALASALGMKSRNLYKMMAGDAPVRDGVLRDTREVLSRRRHAIGLIIQGIRDETAE